MTGEGKDLRTSGAVARGRPVRIQVEEEWIPAFEGETVAAALWASGIRTLRSSPVDRSPRGLFCCTSVCQECVVVVKGKREASCTLPVQDGMRVSLLINR